MKYLHLKNLIITFLPSKINGGNVTAPLSGLIILKRTLNNCRDSRFREGRGTSVEVLTNLGIAILFCHKSTEAVMSKQHPFIIDESVQAQLPKDLLERKLALMEIAVNGAIELMREFEGPNGNFCMGILEAYTQLFNAAIYYSESKGDKLW